MGNLSKFLTGSLMGATGAFSIKGYLRFKQDIRDAALRVKAQGQRIETNFGRIVYGTQGEGPAVLVIHGAGGGFDQALHTARMFGQGFQF